jgi:S-adenosylmethionine decarboxylase
MNGHGLHLLLECDGVAAAALASPARLEAALRAAADAAGAHVLFGHFHHFGEHQGVTGVLLLQESHLSIHSWPEFGYAAIDIFMCGDARPQAAADSLLQSLQPAAHRLQSVARGPLETHRRHGLAVSGG